MAAQIVSGLRISPIKITSGSWRSDARHAILKRGDVGADIPLRKDRPLVDVDELDGVLNREDVQRFVGVDPVDQRSHRGRFAAPRHAGHQHQSVV